MLVVVSSTVLLSFPEGCVVMHGVVVTQPGMERESTASSRFTLFFVFLFIDVVGVVFTLLGDEIGGEETQWRKRRWD